MYTSIKNALLIVIAALVVLLAWKQLVKEAPGTRPALQAGEQTAIGPLTGMNIRFDGYYRTQLGDLIYLLRFFPEGRVVTVNGTVQVEKDLPAFLVRETKGNPSLGLHNVPVSKYGDSLVFITHPEKGEIEYRGVVVSSSMVRFLRHSHITGTKQLMEYVFYPDGAAPSEEDDAQVVEPS